MKELTQEDKEYRWAIIIAIHHGTNTTDDLWKVYPPERKKELKRNFYGLCSIRVIHHDSSSGRLVLRTDKEAKKILAQYLSKEELERI